MRLKGTFWASPDSSLSTKKSRSQTTSCPIIRYLWQQDLTLRYSPAQCRAGLWRGTDRSLRLSSQKGIGQSQLQTRKLNARNPPPSARTHSINEPPGSPLVIRQGWKLHLPALPRFFSSHGHEKFLNEITSPSAVLISADASKDFSKPSGLLLGGDDAPGSAGALTALFPVALTKKLLLRGCPFQPHGQMMSR